MFSLSASPVPTPSLNFPPSISPLVAAAWATTTGCTRVVGQVTAVGTGRAQTRLVAPITLPTKGPLPRPLFQGWEGGLIPSASETGPGAARARLVNWGGGYSPGG